MKFNRENREHLTCALTGEALRPELLDENSMVYKIMADRVSIYSGLAVLVLGTVQPQTIQGLKDHEPIFQKNDNLSDEEKKAGQAKRLRESNELLGGIIFGVTEQDRADAAFALRELHRKIRGHLADGTKYHAWQPEVWGHAWAGIFKGMIDAYGAFRGFKTPVERDEALLGFVEFGKIFGVKGVPDNWEEFDPYWQRFVDGAVVDGTIRQIASLVQNGYFQTTFVRRLKQGKFRGALKLLVSLPVLRLIRVGAIATFPVELDEQLKIKRTIVDKIERKLHQFIWALIPLSLTSKSSPNSFKRRSEKGHLPIWKQRLSRENLLKTREELRERTRTVAASGYCQVK